jgi:enoyl-CoA hydratase
MPVLLERRDDGVVLLTLDDPPRMNAMTADMGDALSARCDELREDTSMRVVVVTGSPPAFSAGGDLGMLEDLAERTRAGGFDATDTMMAFYRRFLTIRDLPVPVIAAINGHAIGAGLCVALACDLRILGTEAKVGLNFSQLGLHPGMAGTWLLPRILGQQRAAEWLYTGRIMTGEVATGHGMALEHVTNDEVLPRALELAAEIATASPVAVRQLRETLRHTETDALEATLEREAAAQAISYGTRDLAEGLDAARSRRRPDFPGE